MSNPPYIARGDIATLAPEVRDYDPRSRSTAATTDLALTARSRRRRRGLLAPGGRLIVELGAGQEAAVRALFTKAGLAVAATL